MFLKSLRRLSPAARTPIDVPTPALVEAIERRMSEACGVPVTISSIERRQVLSASLDRTFHLMRTDGEEPTTLHVRITRPTKGMRRRSRLDHYLTARGYPVPRYFGLVEVDGQAAILWEDCPGVSPRTFGEAPHEQVATAVREMARISATAHDVLDHADVPKVTRWVHPIAHELMSMQADMEGLARHQARLEALAEVEQTFIDSLEGFQPQVLNHNDFVGKNTLMQDDGSVRILDWDSASIGPAGASLRWFAFARDPRTATLPDVYADEMCASGVPVKASDVRHVMQVQQTFWLLSSGVEKRELARIVKGLDYVDRLRREFGLKKAAPLTP